jgi:outer membrane protein OmpA-like peptidoglycan-associated protein
MIVEAEKTARVKDFNKLLEGAISSEMEADKIVRLDYVFFKTGSAELDAMSEFELDNVAEQLNKYPEIQVELSGHTDNVGDSQSNRELSEQRAQTVFDYLVNKGVDAGRLNAKGYGDSLPIETNDTAEGRKLNRRTELKVL